MELKTDLLTQLSQIDEAAAVGVHRELKAIDKVVNKLYAIYEENTEV